MRSTRKTRRGMTAILAMVYLVLFSVLALGFFATVSSSAQVAGNDKRTTEARLASESGMQFIKYHLDAMALPKTTTKAQILDNTYTCLAARIDGTPCMDGATVGVNPAGTQILIPGPDDAFIPIDDRGMEFRVTIERYGEWGLRVTSVGRSNASGSAGAEVRGGRGVRLDYENVPKDDSIFGYGVATSGPVVMDGNSNITGVGDAGLGNMLIATSADPALWMGSNALITGTVAFTDETPGMVLDSGNTIGGVTESSPQFDSKVSTVEPPEFPLIDTDPFKPYAGNPLHGGITITPPNLAGETKFSAGTLQNVLIKASPHTDRWVVFDGNVVINGVIYIETPNKVRFDSNAIVRGVIVAQNNPTHDYTRNILQFDSSAKLRPLSELAGTNNLFFPKELTDLSGPSILAPKFYVDLDSNFGVSGGSIICDKILFDSNANGALDGSVITLANAPLEMDSNATVQIKSRDTSVPGTRLTSSYKPLPTTYREVRP